MLVYPQLATGALSQFPVRKTRRQRTIVNLAADGRSVKLADPAGATAEWQLQYTGLSDAELAALQQFFAAAEGSLNGFTFLDPASNLFAWSDRLDNAAWQKGPLLSATPGVADPTGGANAWQLSNTGGAQSVSQTLPVPGGYVYCLSVYARSAQSTTMTLLRGSDRADRVLGTNWARITFAGSGPVDATSLLFGVEMPGAATVEVYGMQVEPQPAPSVYRATATGGVYENARFRDDGLSVTTTDVNRHSATVNILYVNHL